MAVSDNAPKRQRGRPFPKGVSGNPRGCPRGSKHRVTLALEAMLDGEGEAITRKAIDKAKEGDPVALRLCVERLIPPRKDRPVRFKIPSIASASDTAKAMGGLLQAVAAGDVTPGEASEIAALIEGYRKTLELTEIEARLSALESRNGNKI